MRCSGERPCYRPLHHQGHDQNLPEHRQEASIVKRTPLALGGPSPAPREGFTLLDASTVPAPYRGTTLQNSARCWASLRLWPTIELPRLGDTVRRVRLGRDRADAGDPTLHATIVTSVQPPGPLKPLTRSKAEMSKTSFAIMACQCSRQASTLNLERKGAWPNISKSNRVGRRSADRR